MEENNVNFIWRYDKITDNIQRLSINNVAVENFFYPQKIEEWLANEIERKGIIVINEILERNSVEFMGETEKSNLASWILTQDSRTREYRNEIRQSYDIMEEKFISDHFPDCQINNSEINFPEEFIQQVQMRLMQRFSRLAPVIANYYWILSVNTTDIPYYTSDHPIIKDNIFYNKCREIFSLFGSGKGYLNKGIEFHIPISSESKIILVDTTPLNDLREFFHDFPLFSRIENLINNILKPKLDVVRENVMYYNENITAFSNQYIFSKNDNFEIARNFLERYPEASNPTRRRINIT